MNKDTLSLLQRIYTQVNLALWASLIAFLLFFSIVALPYVRQNQSAAQALRDAEVSVENDMYCRRWNFQPATNAYRSCLDDIHAIRASTRKRMSEELDF